MVLHYLEGRSVQDCSEGGVRLEEGQPGADCPGRPGFEFPKPQPMLRVTADSADSRRTQNLEGPQSWPWGQEARGLFPTCQQFLLALVQQDSCCLSPPTTTAFVSGSPG